MGGGLPEFGGRLTSVHILKFLESGYGFGKGIGEQDRFKYLPWTVHLHRISLVQSKEKSQHLT